MNAKKRYLTMLRMFFIKDRRDKAAYLKRKKIFGAFGADCSYHPKKLPSEPENVFIGNNVHISADVRFITHDVINDMLVNNENYPECTRLPFKKGRIDILDNCVIGAGASIMFNTKIGPNSIVGAGAVVTKDVPSGEIWAGVPAKKIGMVDDLVKRRMEEADNG